MREQKIKSVSWLVRPAQVGKPGVIEVALEGGGASSYEVRALEVDFGDAGFEMINRASGVVHHVLFTGRRDECDCMGHARYGRCKHTTALKMLGVLDKGDGDA